jgi:hypothetical protein
VLNLHRICAKNVELDSDFKTSVIFDTKMCIGIYLKKEKFIPKIWLVCGRIISLKSTEKLLNRIVYI